MIGTDQRLDFRMELQNLLNRYSIENDSDSPDFILAAYLIRCLDAFALTVRERDNWYGYTPQKLPVIPAVSEED